MSLWYSNYWCDQEFLSIGMRYMMVLNISENFVSKNFVKLTLSGSQQQYLDGKVLLDQKLVLLFLSVTCIFHEMLKWKKREPQFENFGGDNVFVKKTLILQIV